MREAKEVQERVNFVIAKLTTKKEARATDLEEMEARMTEMKVETRLYMEPCLTTALSKICSVCLIMSRREGFEGSLCSATRLFRRYESRNKKLMLSRYVFESFLSVFIIF
jgi:hypothetical protein